MERTGQIAWWEDESNPVTQAPLNSVDNEQVCIMCNLDLLKVEFCVREIKGVHGTVEKVGGTVIRNCGSKCFGRCQAIDLWKKAWNCINGCGWLYPTAEPKGERRIYARKPSKWSGSYMKAFRSKEVEIFGKHFLTDSESWRALQSFMLITVFNNDGKVFTLGNIQSQWAKRARSVDTLFKWNPSIKRANNNFGHCSLDSGAYIVKYIDKKCNLLWRWGSSGRTKQLKN